MLKKSVLSIIALFCLVGFTTDLAAQKYGHLNYGNLLSIHPEVKKGDAQLAEFRDQLVKQGEKMAKDLETKYLKIEKEVAEGLLTAVQIQNAEAELKKEQQTILKFEQEVIQKVNKKREELLKPIIDKINAAIEAVGKENGYAMIFDTSLYNTVLFAEDSEDVMPKVKAKLGL